MAYVKFTKVKLIINFIPLICLFLFSTEICIAQQKYSVQIAALKTPRKISDLAKQFNIYDSITVKISGDWYLYLIGSFDNYNVASDYAKELIHKTKLTNVFVQVIDPDPEIANEIFRNDTSDNLSLKSPEIDSLQPHNIDSSQQYQYEEITKNEKEPPGDKNQSSTKNKGEKNVLNLIFEKEKISSLKSSLIDYCNNNLPRETRRFYLGLIDKSFQFPIIFLFTALILFFILNLIFVFFLLNYTIKKKSQKERFIMLYSKIYEQVLLSYMFGEIDWESAIVKLKKKNRKSNRKILIKTLLNFQANFKGEMEKNVLEIFIKLNLQKDSLKLANSWFDYRKVQGIRELTLLYPEGAHGLVPNLINHSNDNVRAEAQTAFIRLNPDTPFVFFQTLTKPFTRWTQLAAFNLIRVNQLPVPSFANFLKSKHLNIRNFSLRMIIYFQQLENANEILKMLESNNEQTRLLSYKAINDLRLYEGKEIIKQRFWNETLKNKLEIVKAFKNIGLDEDFDFLETIINSETVSLKIEACRTMYFMNTGSRERLLERKNELNADLDLLIAHVTDLRN